MKAILFLSLYLTVLFGATDLVAQNAKYHEFVSKGTHKNELGIGDYVVVKTFDGEKEARNECDEIKKSGITEIVYGYLTKKEQWYVCFKSSANIEEARKLREKYSQTERFKDAWLLTVHQ